MVVVVVVVSQLAYLLNTYAAAQQNKNHRHQVRCMLLSDEGRSSVSMVASKKIKNGRFAAYFLTFCLLFIVRLFGRNLRMAVV